MAKDEGRRSRAFFKLAEIDRKYRLIAPGFKVADLGAWPGSWMEYALEKVGSKGLVVGIDLAEMQPFNQDNAKTIQGDLYKPETSQAALEVAGSKFDLVISDMSPKLTGIKEADRLSAVGLAELAVYLCKPLLKPKGNLVMKVFKCGETDEFIKNCRKQFDKLVRMELESTRKTSNEYYAIGLGFNGRN